MSSNAFATAASHLASSSSNGAAAVPQPPLHQTYTAQDIITKLNLTPHVEAGYFLQTFEDLPSPSPPSSTNGASTTAPAASTAIYYLLEGSAGPSSWHRVLHASEVWHYYAGAPLVLSLAADDGRTPVRKAVLGPDVFAKAGPDGEGEQRPQIVVQKGEWQRARSLGEWTLVGCTVAPGFTMDGFVMAAPGWEPRTS